MAVMLWLAVALFVVVVASYDPNLSNGTCYYGANKQAAESYIPCGNAAGGVKSCCQARDVCLSSNACFNGQFYVTYLAGCTDELYSDLSCPKKGEYSDEQWVGLVRCFVSNSTGEEWSPCEEPAQPTVNKGNQQCSCDPSSSTAVFTDSATLTNIASLPVSAGNAIAWFPGFEPSTTTTDSTITTPNSVSASTAMTSVSALSTVSPEPSSSPSISTKAKAGIGVGSAAFVMITIAVAFFIWYHRRSRRTIPPIKDQIRPSSMGPWSIGGRTMTERNPSNIVHHEIWTRKSELPTEANEITTGKTSLGENTTRTTFNNPVVAYQPYQHSPTVETSEIGGSPAASTSGLTNRNTAYDRLLYQEPIYEMPA